MTEYANAAKNGILAAIAAVGAVVSRALGGWDITLQILVGAMAADYLTGVIVAAVFSRSRKSKTGALSSSASFRGLLKKGGVLLVVLVAAMLDRLLGVDFVRTATALFFIGNECISVLENAGLMGVPLPKFLVKTLEALRDKGDTGEVPK